jgi:hypothetical protein
MIQPDAMQAKSRKQPCTAQIWCGCLREQHNRQKAQETGKQPSFAHTMRPVPRRSAQSSHFRVCHSCQWLTKPSGTRCGLSSFACISGLPVCQQGFAGSASVKWLRTKPLRTVRRPGFFWQDRARHCSSRRSASHFCPLQRGHLNLLAHDGHHDCPLSWLDVAL